MAVGGTDDREALALEVMRQQLADCSVVLGDQYRLRRHVGRCTRRHAPLGQTRSRIAG
jgi:hypothetical protein